MSTDLFIAVSGLSPATVIAAVPPACRTEPAPAPPAAADGDDLTLEFGPWRPRRPARHFVASWSLLAPGPAPFRFELSVERGGGWTPWSAAAAVGDADFPPLPAAVDGLAADVDLWRAAEPAAAVRLRLRLRPGRERAAPSAPWLAALSASDLAPAPAPCGAGAGVRLDVPPLSQVETDPALAARICSPTSVAMALAFHGAACAPAALAGEMFHRALDLYGVWPAAIAAGGRRGVAGYLLRFPDWASAAWCLGRGLPVVVSVRYEAGELAGAAAARTAGHLIVLTGCDGDEVLVNDPAAPDAGSVPRRYRLRDLARVWLERAGVGYVFFRP